MTAAPGIYIQVISGRMYAVAADHVDSVGRYARPRLRAYALQAESAGTWHVFRADQPLTAFASHLSKSRARVELEAAAEAWGTSEEEVVDELVSVGSEPPS